MLKGPVPRGFTISFRGRRKRWTWKQVVEQKSPDHVMERDGFTSHQRAAVDLGQELQRRRESEETAI